MKLPKEDFVVDLSVAHSNRVSAVVVIRLQRVVRVQLSLLVGLELGVQRAIDEVAAHYARVFGEQLAEVLAPQIDLAYVVV